MLPKKLQSYFFISEEFNNVNLIGKNKETVFCWHNNGGEQGLFPYKLLDGKTAYSNPHFSFGGIITRERGLNLNKLISELLDDLRSKKIVDLIIQLPPNIYKAIPHEQLVYFKALSKNIEILGLETFPVLPLDMKVLSKSKKKYLGDFSCDIRWNQKSDLYAAWHVLEENLRIKYGTKPFHSASEIFKLHVQNPDNIAWNVRHMNSEILGIQVYFLIDNVVHNQYTASSANGKKLHTADFLTGNAIHKYIKQSQFYDFGKSSTDEGDKMNFSLLEYKMRWGCTAMLAPIMKFEI